MVPTASSAGTTSDEPLARRQSAVVSQSDGAAFELDGAAVEFGPGSVSEDVAVTVEVAHLGYLVREKDFSFRKGVISRSVTTVPFARIQHVSIDRGPLARRFGLATLQMRTAGDGLTVPGIGHEAAQQLKALVVDRAGVAADEELAEGAAAAVSRPAAPPPAAPAPVSGPAEPAGPTELR